MQLDLHILLVVAHNAFALFQPVAVLVHVLDGLDHTLGALPHLSDGVGSVDKVPVALPHHLSQLLLLLLDVPADFTFDPADLFGVVPLEQHCWVLDLRDPERQRMILSHHSTKTTPTDAGTSTRKYVKDTSGLHVSNTVTKT